LCQAETLYGFGTPPFSFWQVCERGRRGSSPHSCNSITCLVLNGVHVDQYIPVCGLMPLVLRDTHTHTHSVFRHAQCMQESPMRAKPYVRQKNMQIIVRYSVRCQLCRGWGGCEARGCAQPC